MAAPSLISPFRPNSILLLHPPSPPSSPSLFSAKPSSTTHFYRRNHGLLLPLLTHKPRATSSDLLPAPADPPPEMVPDSAAAGDVGSTLISGLFLLAFIALSILTIGVIYIAVTDFLQKREREKFEKEESAANEKKKKGGKKNNVRAKAGPRGFGQKVEEDED